MKFQHLLSVVGDEATFESGLLLAGKVDVADVRRQLSRWTASKKIIQLRRGLYTLAPPHQRVKPHPFVIANRLEPASYVSAESALAHWGHIPEYVPVTISVTTGRPARRDTAFGRFEFRHVKQSLFWGFRLVDLGQGRRAHLAVPEKALLDLVYLTPGADRTESLRELRLQDLDRLNLRLLEAFARRAASPKLLRAARRTAALEST